MVVLFQGLQEEVNIGEATGAWRAGLGDGEKPIMFQEDGCVWAMGVGCHFGRMLVSHL